MPGSNIKLRKVEIDFSDAKIHWSPNEPEFSQTWNAMSTAIPYLEGFLIKALRQTKEHLPDDLRREVDLFISQEGRHSKVHIKFNRVLRDAGYDIEPWERKLQADYDRFLKKGMKFALAYGEGFETFGPILSSFFFEGAPDLTTEWDEPTCYLWMWHLAEEYEHRHVANYAFKELYGDYWYRIYALWFTSVHLFSYQLRLANLLIRQDLERGLIRGRRASRLRFARVTARLMAYMLPRVLFVCHRRGYDPGELPPPKNVMAFLDEASERYGVVEPV